MAANHLRPSFRFALTVLTGLLGGVCLNAGDSPPLTRPAAKSSVEWEASLLAVPELSLQSGKDRPDPFHVQQAGEDHPLLALIDGRGDLRGLPFLRGADCQGPAVIGRVSRDLRGQLAQLYRAQRRALSGPTELSPTPRDLAPIAKDHPTLIWQMCECEPAPIRRVALATLRHLEGPRVAETLARIVLFDPDADLRRTAATALLTRPPQLYRPVLLSAFAHPWGPAADHAAAALELLNDHASVPALVRVLEAGDPSAPKPDANGTPVVRELVRINHARNCQLCHAPSWSRNDPARIAVPSANEPLPPSFSVEYYSPEPKGPVVRTDVTYLRQDFSRVLRVLNPGRWPLEQRYDFFVRSRPAAAGEATAPPQAKTPQRVAALRTLQTLTGVTAGDNVEVWKRYVRLNYREGR